MDNRLSTEERLHVAQFSVDRTADGVYWVNRGGRILYVNDASCRSLGYTREELLSMTVADIDPGFPAAAWPEHWREVQARGSFTFESSHKRKDGTIFPVEITVNYLKYGAKEYNCAFARNITERRYAEEQIRGLNEELRQSVARLEAANRDLEAFAHTMSHDLRSPITVIEGFSHVLLEKPKEPSKQQHYLTLIAKGASHMHQLIDGLLRFFALGRQEITFSSIEMTELVRDVWSEVSSLQEDRNLRLEITALPPAQGDAVMVRQVFTNLFENAIKFRKTDQTTIIEVGGNAEGAMSCYYVKDNGIGFPNEQAQKIFDVFERLHGKYEGSGLGLSIVKRIVERHSGRVWAEGKEGAGATFSFTLPAIGGEL